MRYTLYAGNRVQPFTIDGNGHTTLHPHRRTKSDVTYTDEDKLPEGTVFGKYLAHHVSIGPEFYVFWLPNNEAGYTGFIVAKVRVKVEDL